MNKSMIAENHVVVFNNHKIRRVFHENAWWFVVVDVVAVLSDSARPSGYKTLKGLERENLRDHMTGLELIFTMLGEASTTEIARKEDAQGFEENRSAARSGGEVAGNAREDLEKRIRKKVTTKQNYLGQTQKQIKKEEIS